MPRPTTPTAERKVQDQEEMGHALSSTNPETTNQGECAELLVFPRTALEHRLIPLVLSYIITLRAMNDSPTEYEDRSIASVY
jgi:hypothetical protein